MKHAQQLINVGYLLLGATILNLVLDFATDTVEPFASHFTLLMLAGISLTAGRGLREIATGSPRDHEPQAS